MALKLNSSGGGSVTLDVGSTASNYTVTLPSSTGTLVTTFSSPSFAGITDSGNLTFTGTGNRIIGDFSNTTLTNRVAFQTSTTNSNTGVFFIPNGTAVSSSVQCFNTADPTNSGRINIQITSVDAVFESGITGTGSYLPMLFRTGGSERMRIDSSGNVGIGTSSPGVKFVVSQDQNAITYSDVANVSTGSSAAVDFRLITQNVANTGTTSVDIIKYKTGGFFINNYDTNAAVYTAFGVGASERMRIDSSGNVGIGVVPSGSYKLQVNGIGYFTSTGTPLYAQATGAGDSIISYAGTGTVTLTSVGRSSDNSSKIRFLNNAFSSELSSITETGTSNLTFATAGSERMRIDASGNLLVNTTSQVLSGAKVQIVNNSYKMVLRDSGATAGKFWRFDADGNNSVIIYNQNSAGVWIGDGGTAWNSSSDESLKENLFPITDAINKVTNLRSVTGNYIKDPDKKTHAFLIAQDVQKVLPEAVTEDAEGKLGLAYTEVIPLLVAAIKELKAELDATKAEVAELRKGA